MSDETILSSYTAVQPLRVEGSIRSYRGKMSSGTEVCIKVVDADADATGMALRSIALLRNVQSLNVAPVVASRIVTGGLYFVREWVPGASLASEKLRATLPLKAQCSAVAQGLEGMSDVHAAGLVCGDVKPSNFIVSRGGEATLVDPLTPYLEAGEGDEPPETALYTSPEEIRGEAPSQKSDIFRAGLVLYELIAGRPPFPGADAAAVAAGHLSATPDVPSALNPSAPKDLDAVVLRALSKDPSARFESAAAMQKAIEEALEPRRSVWPLLLFAGLVALVLILAGGTAVSGVPPWVWLLGRAPATVSVPGIVGKSQSAAEASITAAGLSVGTVSKEATLGIAPGTVTTQTPAPGVSVAPSSAVSFSVAELPTAEVPKVTGLEESDATEQLADVGLKVGTLTYANDSTVKPGYVMSQSPDAGTQLQLGASVDLTVSKGPKNSKVPNVVGLPQNDASSTLKAAGFKVTATKASDANVPAGSVISQSPAAGVTATSGSTVTINVSTGKPQAPKVTVPNVVGMRPRDAAKALNDLQLTRGFAFAPTTPEKVLTVLQQSPAAGAQVAPGTRVTITIGLPSPSEETTSTPTPQPPSSPPTSSTPPSSGASPPTVTTPPANQSTTTP